FLSRVDDDGQPRVHDLLLRCDAVRDQPAAGSTTRARLSGSGRGGGHPTTMTTRTHAANALVGTAIGLYAIFDTLIVGLPILVLAIRFNALAVFGIAAAAVFLLNVACSTWGDPHWGLF